MDSLTEMVSGLELDQVLTIVRQLRADGFRQGTDFDFTFKPAVMSSMSYETISERHTIFHFYNPELATLFALKYT
jgi:hypothetical protein